MAKKIVDESGFDWKVKANSDNGRERVIIDRDGAEWTVPTEAVIAEMRDGPKPAPEK